MSRPQIGGLEGDWGQKIDFSKVVCDHSGMVGEGVLDFESAQKRVFRPQDASQGASVVGQVALDSARFTPFLPLFSHISAWLICTAPRLPKYLPGPTGMIFGPMAST